MLDKFKLWLFPYLCPHKVKVGAIAPVFKQTHWDDDKNIVNRRALCCLCGAIWENIPDWDKFKVSPGRPPKKGQA